jgi:hypothetical protein
VFEDDDCSADADCEDIFGGFICTCKDGFLGDGKVCKDIDECASNSTQCHEHSTCKNYAGTYKCECDEGYEGDDKSCTEIDECQIGTPCKNGATCTDKLAAVQCTCAPGWRGESCAENINECAEKTFKCVENSKCKDTAGSYDCECDAGYEKKDGECTEIDECATKPCKHGSACLDEFLGFTCTCVRGWRGETCEEVDDNLQSASKKTESSGTGTAVGLVAGVAAAIVVIIIVVVAAFIILRHKQANITVVPSTIVPKKVKSGAPKSMEPVFAEPKIEPAKPESDIEEVSFIGVVTDEEVEDEIASLQEYTGTAGNETLTLGQRVVAHGYQTGVIKYIGELKSMPSMNGVTYIGIKLDKPEGSGDGTVNGVRYFDCERFCSVFVTPHTVKAI